MSEDSCFLLDRGRRTGIENHRKQGYSVLPRELREELYRTIYVLHIVILIIKRYCCVPHLLSSSFYLQRKLSMMKYFPLLCRPRGWHLINKCRTSRFLFQLRPSYIGIFWCLTIQHVQMFSFFTHSLHLN